MISSKYMNWIIAAILLIAIAFTTVFMFSPQSLGVVAATSEPEYASKLFNTEDIISIDIKADEEEWNTMLENATSEEYISCDVTINGTTFYSVGVRPKGNSSLSMVASSDSDRYSFKFEFDKYVKGQTCFGLDKFVINNIQADATYMKEYLSYDLLDYMGVTSPLNSYTNVTVNGEDIGFYLAIEGLEESFAQRNYGLDYGMLYKPEGMGMGGGNGGMKEAVVGNNGENTKVNGEKTAPPTMPGENSQNNIDKNIPDEKITDNNAGENKNNRPEGNFGGGMENGFPGGNGGNGGPGGNSGGGADLKYSDDEISSYSTIFEGEVFKGTESDYARVIKALKNLNDGTDLERYIDVDQVLRYFAVNTVLVNLDSYVTNMKHNYYLYEKDGQLSMVPWDYNLSFAGFQSGSATSAVNFPIDTPVSGVELSERPMLGKLLEVEEYKNTYHKYLQEIVDGYFNSGKFENTIDNINTLISDYVKNDPTAFYTYEEYTAAVPALKEFGELRAESIQGQLDGTIPSTTDGQSAEPDKLVDASTINLSTLGTQGGGGKDGGRDGMGQPPTGNATNNGDENRNPSSNNGAGNENLDTSKNPPSNGNMQGGKQQGDMPNMEVMSEVMNIIQEANGSELTEEQLQKIKDLGIPEEQIEMIKNMAQGKGGMQPGGNFGQGGKPSGNVPGSSNGNGSTPVIATAGNIIPITISTIFLIGGLAFVMTYKRKG